MSLGRSLGDHIAVPIEPDESGFVGRECPNQDCLGYFKIQFGTGLKGDALPCHCPYCGHTAAQDEFWTREQLEYARSVAFRAVADALTHELKKMEFDLKPKGPFGIGMSLKVQAGQPIPLSRYREKTLETEVVCNHCGLRYSVYGVFAFCPDCGQHNSLQILGKNLDVVGKTLDLAGTVQDDLRRSLIENALEDCVSAFDGLGRELCRIHAGKCSAPARAEKISFQNLEGARQVVTELFGIDMATGLETGEWSRVAKGFQKRHVIAHRMGIVDDDYVRKTADPRATVGHKLPLEAEEIRELARVVGRLAESLTGEFARIP